ncbi:MAG: SAF domain-containing protein [Anaerolineae bacterium]
MVVQTISVGTIVSETQVELRAYPAQLVPALALTNLDDGIGRVARSDIDIEQIIFEDYVQERVALPLYTVTPTPSLTPTPTWTLSLHGHLRLYSPPTPTATSTWTSTPTPTPAALCGVSSSTGAQRPRRTCHQRSTHRRRRAGYRVNGDRGTAWNR